MILTSFIVAVSTAMFAPGISNNIPEPDLLPIVAAEVINQPLPELKPLPSTKPNRGSACNCYNILKDTFSDVPPMAAILREATSTVGNVAVMQYPATPDFPNGMPHVALVRSVLPDGSLEIEEYNYQRCTHSTRIIPRDYHRLVGFTTL